MECGSEHVQITLCPSGRYIWFVVLPNIVGLFYEEMFFLNFFPFLLLKLSWCIPCSERELTASVCLKVCSNHCGSLLPDYMTSNSFVFSSRAKVTPAIHSVSSRYFSQLLKLFNSSSSHNYWKNSQIWGSLFISF